MEGAPCGDMRPGPQQQERYLQDCLCVLVLLICAQRLAAVIQHSGLRCVCVTCSRVVVRTCLTCPAQVSEKRSEAERETRKRERLEKDARDLRAQVDAKNDEVRVCVACVRVRSKHWQMQLCTHAKSRSGSGNSSGSCHCWQQPRPDRSVLDKNTAAAVLTSCGAQAPDAALQRQVWQHTAALSAVLKFYCCGSRTHTHHNSASVHLIDRCAPSSWTLLALRSRWPSWTACSRRRARRRTRCRRSTTQ